MTGLGLGLTISEEKIAAIAKLTFPTTLKALETYLGMTGWLRDYIPFYTQKAEPLHRRKTLLLQQSPSTKGKARKLFSLRTAIKEPSAAELISFQAIQDAFAQPTFLTHFDPTQTLHIDVDASKERGFGAVAYHIRDGNSKATPHSVMPIIFLSKCLTPAQSRYWPTELEVAGLLWVVRRLHHMIRASLTPTVVWTDHASTPGLLQQIKLSATNTDKLNLRLIRAAT